MANKTKFLVIIGVLIGIGAALLFVGSQSITADIIIQEGQIDETNSIRIEAMLDPEINTEGVFAVQTLEETKELILATVFDPNGVKIIETSINQNSFEEIFEISSIGFLARIIRSATKPDLILPKEFSRLKYFAGLVVADWIASRAGKPDSCNSSISWCKLNPGTKNPIGVSVPAINDIPFLCI